MLALKDGFCQYRNVPVHKYNEIVFTKCLNASYMTARLSNTCITAY